MIVGVHERISEIKGGYWEMRKQKEKKGNPRLKNVSSISWECNKTCY